MNKNEIQLNYILALDRLRKEPYFTRETYVGEVLENADNLGRIKVMIPSLFDGLNVNDLPWINMEPSVNCIVKPETGKKVLVQFKGSIYEGFYNANYITDSTAGDVGVENFDDFFIFNCHGVKIYGKYDGSVLKIESDNLKITDENGQVNIDTGSGQSLISMDNLGNVTIDHKLIFELKGSAVIPTGQGGLCALPFCVVTGTPHTGTQLAPAP